MNNNFIMNLHNHTTWSDGNSTPEELVIRNIQSGINVIGITDHFATSKCNSVSIRGLENYVKNIEDIKNKYKSKAVILSGIEICMINSWSELDRLPYELLNELDFVLLEYIDDYSGAVKLIEVDKYISKIRCKIGLAHTDIFNLALNYEDEGGLDYVLHTLNEYNIFWEINTNKNYDFFDEIISRKDNFNIKYLFNLISKNAVKVSTGADTHILDMCDFKRLKHVNEIIHENFQSPFMFHKSHSSI